MIAEFTMDSIINELKNESDQVVIPYQLISTAFLIGMKPNEWTVFTLIESINREGREIPSVKELAVTIGLSERQLHMILTEMRDKNYVEVIKQGKKNVGYDFSPLKKQIRIVQIQQLKTNRIKRHQYDSK
jgi:hypothetical protein